MDSLKKLKDKYAALLENTKVAEPIEEKINEETYFATTGAFLYWLCRMGSLNDYLTWTLPRRNQSWTKEEDFTIGNSYL